MDKDNIEDKAVNKVESLLLQDNRLLPNISKRDKCVSWDGSIEIYKSGVHTKTDLLGRVNVQVKGLSATKEDFIKYNKSYSLPYQINTSDVINYFKDGNQTVLFVVYIYDDMPCFFYQIFPNNDVLDESTKEKLKKQKSISIRLKSFNVPQKELFFFFYGLLHIEEKTYYQKLLYEIWKKMRLNDWFYYSNEADDLIIRDSFYSGCINIAKIIPNKDDTSIKLHESIVVFKRVLNDFSLLISTDFVELHNHSQGDYYKVHRFHNIWDEKEINHLLKNDFFQHLEFPLDKISRKANYVFDLYTNCFIHLFWQLGAAINNILYCYREKFGRFKFIALEHRSLRCYDSSSLFKGEYNAYLNLDLLNVNYSYSPIFYKPYQGITSLQKKIQKCMKIEDYI